MTKVIEGDFSANTAKFTLVVGRFNSAIVDNLCAGAIDTLRRQGVPEANITVVRSLGLMRCRWQQRGSQQRAVLTQ